MNCNDEREEEGSEKVIIRDLRDNDILSSGMRSGSGLSKAEVDRRPGNALFLQIIQEYSKSYHGARTREEKNDIAKLVLTALSKRNPTGRFLTSKRNTGRFVKKLDGGDNDEYVVLRETSVYIKIHREFERLAPQAELPRAPKRTRRASKRMQQSADMEATTKKKKKRGRPKQSLPMSTTNDSSAAPTVHEEPYDLGKLAKRFMLYAFVSVATVFLLQSVARTASSLVSPFSLPVSM